MAFKFVTVMAFVAAVSAGLVPVPQVYHPAAEPTTLVKAISPASYGHPQAVFAKHEDHQFNSHPQYKFAYDVNDQHTGDNHSQSEERDGDFVHGEYSLIDADGFRRIVQYTVDPHSGFNAIVNRIPLEHVQKVVKVAPVAPITYGGPIHGSVVKQYPSYNPYH